jgi:acyl dehydratase
MLMAVGIFNKRGDAIVGLYFDEFSVGQPFRSMGRTVTEADVVNFTGLSLDSNPIHMDKQFAGNGHFGQRIAHGILVVSMVTGLIHQLNIIDNTTIALLEYKSMKFLRPVFLGDTVYVDVNVLDKKETSKKDRGVITLGYTVKKQDEEAVISMEILILVKRAV